MALEEISRLAALEPGDQIQIHIRPRFSLGQTIDTMALAAKLSKIEDDPQPGWQIGSIEWPDGGGAIVNISITDYDPTDYTTEAGLITTGTIIAAIVGISLIVLSVSAYKVTDRVGEIVDTPGGAVAAATFGIGGTIVIAIIVLWLIGKYK